MGGSDTCGWLGPSRTVCTNYKCTRAHYAEVDRENWKRAKRNRKKTPAEIHALIARKGRGSKSKPGGRVA